MITRSLVAAALLTLASAPALAAHCPADVKAIDNALTKVNLSSSQMADVKKLRDEGEALHNAGKHKESVDTLSNAMRIILNNL